MSSILKVKDANGNWIDIPAIVGPKGDSVGADYIIERGTSDIVIWESDSEGLPVEKNVGTWTWQKWDSGDADCWAALQDVTLVMPYGGGEAPYALTCELPLPASLFVDSSYSVFVQVNGCGVPNIFKFAVPSTTSVLGLGAYTEDEGDITANMTVLVKGRWE